jgi:tRNA U34 5-methylaminomethyl-2-thiouridine-forming methyltransferase MnmC
LKRSIITTADGSKTIQIEEWNEQYHSIHGAIQEAKHVYIKSGLLFCIESLLDNSRESFEESQKISILEIGFGTGLNAFLTLLKAEELKQNIKYSGVEAYPILPEELQQLNYIEQLSAKHLQHAFEILHQSPWEKEIKVTSYFQLFKQQKQFQDVQEENTYDLIYFDAFGPRVQPELWTEHIFKIMYKALKPNGVLVTYSVNGSARRAMLSVGFLVEKIPGPPGKREMLRARKGS